MESCNQRPSRVNAHVGETTDMRHGDDAGEVWRIGVCVIEAKSAAWWTFSHCTESESGGTYHP